jgi:metal-responsive CopG/Arc/MetJ family transcriptional regulator
MNEPQGRSNDEPRRIGTTFSDAELSAIDEWGFARRIRSRSEAIRRLVEKGLKGNGRTTTEE